MAVKKTTYKVVHPIGSSLKESGYSVQNGELKKTSNPPPKPAPNTGSSGKNITFHNDRTKPYATATINGTSHNFQTKEEYDVATNPKASGKTTATTDAYADSLRKYEAIEKAKRGDTTEINRMSQELEMKKSLDLMNQDKLTEDEKIQAIARRDPKYFPTSATESQQKSITPQAMQTETGEELPPLQPYKTTGELLKEAFTYEGLGNELKSLSVVDLISPLFASPIMLDVLGRQTAVLKQRLKFAYEGGSGIGGLKNTVGGSQYSVAYAQAKQVISEIRKGNPEVSVQQAKNDIRSAQQAYINIRGYVHNEGKYDPYLTKNGGYLVELQLKNMEDDLKNLEGELAIAELKGQKAQIVLENTFENVRKQELAEKYGIK